MTLPDLRALFDDPLHDARAHRAAGAGPLVGVIGAGVPVELIEGAGALAVRLKGGAARPTPLADRYMEDSCDPHLRRIMDRMLAGDFALFDLIVVSRATEGQLQLYYLAQHLRAQGLALPPLVLFDLLQTPTDRTRRHLRARLIDLAATLAALPGAADPLPALADRIPARNDARARFRAACASRVRTGLDRLRLAAAGQVVTTDRFRDLIAALPDPGPARAAPRVTLSGSTQDHDALYRQIEGGGLTISAEDHDWGARLYHHDVATGPDPVASLAAHCQAHTPGPRHMSPMPPEFLPESPDARPDGVIFVYDAHDDTLGWDYPGHRNRLDAAGIPVLMLRGDWTPARIAQDLGGFHQALRDRADTGART